MIVRRAMNATPSRHIRCVWNRSVLIRLVAAAWLLAPHHLFGEERPTARRKATFFENEVRPLLAKHCYECHGVDEQESQLRVDSRVALLEGGERGPAIQPGDAGKSLLMRAVRYKTKLKMPPTGKLSTKELAVLERWITDGAVFPNGNENGRSIRRHSELTEEDRNYWAFRPVRRTKPPPVENRTWLRSPMDSFIASRLESERLIPRDEAKRRHLLRRLSFDLRGVPPSPTEVSAFLGDTSPNAYERFVDRWLASPQYGERWARHWLDVVRYAQTNGYERDDEKPFAWRYRDYVIRAFNADKPFSTFVREQLAGDELESVTDDSLDATGFFRLHVWDDEPDDKRQAEFDALDDVLSTTSAAFLGLTIGCCRCHDHRFDPIPQRDYYRMLAFVRNVKTYVRPEEKSADATIFAPLPSGAGKTLAVREQGPQSPPTHVFVRGDSGAPTDEVSPGFLQVLHSDVPAQITASDRGTSGRRSVLANWIANPENPLTARVIVNRLWQHHFGRALVETPNDFGRAGFRPSHPQLLDWLATELIAADWSLKHVHRMILLSSVYRQSSASGDPMAMRIDPDNRLLWRQNMRRLEAEAIRDSVLTVTGHLNRSQFGRGFFPQLSNEVLAGQSMPGRGWELSSSVERSRRSVYLFIKRTMLPPLVESLDLANTEMPVGARATTTIAPQALNLLNSRFMEEQARRFALRLTDDVGADVEDQVHRAFALCLSREPTQRELTVAVDFIREQTRMAASTPLKPTFVPLTPVALHKSYLQRLSPHDFLSGPRDGWSYQRGQWNDRGDGIHWIDPRTPPFGLADDILLKDGIVQARLHLSPRADRCGLLFRAVSSGAGVWRGYAVMLEPSEQRVALLKRTDGGVQELAAANVSVPSDARLFVRAAGAKLDVSFDGERPILSVEDATPILEGQVGVFAGGAPLALTALRVTNARESIEVPLPPPAFNAAWHAPPTENIDPRWEKFAGNWIATKRGTLRVDAERGPFMIRRGLQLSDGVVECDIKIDRPGEIGGLMIKVNDPRIGADTWFGYEVALNIPGKAVRLGKHENNFQLLAERGADIEASRWHRLRVETAGATLVVSVDGKVVVRHVDSSVMPGGEIGIRTWGSAMKVRNLVVESSAGRQPIPLVSGSRVEHERPLPATNELRGLAAFCKVMLNLNEFVYVD